MLTFLTLLAVTTAAPAPCDPALLRPAVKTAAAAFDKKDWAAVKTALAPALACPVTDGVSYVAHVMRAEVADVEQDWPTVRSMLAGVGVHPEAQMSPVANFLRLRADLGLKDNAAFAADRMAMLAANDAVLSKIGRRVEIIPLEKMRVIAYQAELDQGVLHRVYEFILLPDDAAAFPMSILLTKDTGVDTARKEMNDVLATVSEMWFVDLYTCDQHVTLETFTTAKGATPTYEEAKKHVLDGLNGKRSGTSSTQRNAGGCFGGRWMLPGLGLRQAAS